MSPRIQYVERRGRFIHSIDKTEFPYDVGNPASRREALKRLETHAENVIAFLDGKAGRQLSPRELAEGFAPVEDRSHAERVADASAEAMKAQKPHFDNRTSNPFERALEMGLGDKKTETKDEMYKRLSREWQAKRDAETAKAEFDSDPRRLKAVAHAETELQALRYDPTATVKEVRAAEHRLEIARHGDLGDYARLDRSWREVKQFKIDEATAEIDAHIADLRKRKADVAGGAFEMPEPPPPPEPPKLEPVPMMSREEYEAGRAATAKLDADRIAAENKRIGGR